MKQIFWLFFFLCVGSVIFSSTEAAIEVQPWSTGSFTIVVTAGNPATAVLSCTTGLLPWYSFPDYPHRMTVWCGDGRTFTSEVFVAGETSKTLTLNCSYPLAWSYEASCALQGSTGFSPGPLPNYSETRTISVTSTSSNALCGSAHKTYPYSATSFWSDSFCSVGILQNTAPLFPAPWWSVTWTCLSQSGWLGASCGATRASTGTTIRGEWICGSASGSSLSTAPTLNLCTSWTPSSVTETASGFSWSCSGTGGGANMNCQAYRISSSSSWVCGSAINTPSLALPKENLCAYGNASTVTEGGNSYQWTCTATGTSPTTCSSRKLSGSGAFDLWVQKYIMTDTALLHPTTQSGAPVLSRGNTFRYVLRVKNQWLSPSVGTTILTDMLPHGITVSKVDTDKGIWTCTLRTPQASENTWALVRCETNSILDGSGSFPDIVIEWRIGFTAPSVLENTVFLTNVNQINSRERGDGYWLDTDTVFLSLGDIAIPLCGAANGVPTQVAPSLNLCANGSPSSIWTDGQNYIWTCSLNGRELEKRLCSAPQNVWWEKILPKLSFVLPPYLLISGTSLIDKWIRILKNKYLDTTAMYPSETFGVDLRTASRDVNFWKVRMPEEDRDRGTILVIPTIGIVAPVNDLDWSGYEWGKESFAKLMQWEVIWPNVALRNGVMRYPGSSLPWEVGNSIILWHSSYYKSERWRYKTVFSNVMELDPWEEVWFFKRVSDEYLLYRYRVTASYETYPEDVNVLLPWEGEAKVTLFTCTPIWGVTKRWIISWELIHEDGEACQLTQSDGTNLSWKWRWPYCYTSSQSWSTVWDATLHSLKDPKLVLSGTQVALSSWSVRMNITSRANVPFNTKESACQLATAEKSFSWNCIAYSIIKSSGTYGLFVEYEMSWQSLMREDIYLYDFSRNVALRVTDRVDAQYSVKRFWSYTLYNRAWGVNIRVWKVWASGMYGYSLPKSCTRTVPWVCECSGETCEWLSNVRFVPDSFWQSLLSQESTGTIEL